MDIASIFRKLKGLLPGSGLASGPVRPLAGVALSEQEVAEWFHSLFDALPDTVGLMDVQGRLVMENASGARLYGYDSPEQMVAEAKSVLGLLAPSDRERNAAELAALLERGSMGPKEFEFVRRDGSTFPAEVTAAVIRDSDSQPVGILGLVRDTSRRRRAQEMLRAYADKIELLAQTAMQLTDPPSPADAYQLLADRLRQLSDALIVAVSTYDSRTGLGKVRVVSGADHYQAMVQRVLGGSPMGLTFPLSEEARRMVETGRLHDVPSLYALAFGLVPEDAATMVEEAIGVGQIHSIGLVKDKQILGLAGIIMPRGQSIPFPAIVETLARQSTGLLLRQLAEQSLRESEQRFRTLFQEIGDAFVLLDGELRVVDCHDTPQGLLQFCRERLVGQRLNECLPELARAEPALMDDLRQVLLTGASRTYTRVHYLSADAASPIYLDLTAYAVRLGGQPHVALLCRDVSARVSLEAQLLQAQSHASYARIVSGLIHDVGGLLAVIRAAADLMADVARDDSLAQDAIGGIQSAVERLDDLRRRMVNLGRAETAPLEILDLNDAVREAMVLLHHLVEGNVRLEFLPAKQSILLWGDEARIVRVLVNLADNALDAMPDGGSLTIETRLGELDAERAKDWGMEAGLCALLMVRDTGTGISRDNLGRLFDPFFSTKARERHSGLGLSTVAEIVKEHKGHIEVQSVLGEGTTFTIYFPALDTSDLEQ